MGADGPQEKQRGVDGLAQERRPLRAGHAVQRVALEVVEGVDELHHRADGGIEVEVALDVGGDARDRLVDDPAEGSARLRERARPGRPGRADLLAMRVDEAPEAVEEARGAFHPALRPLEVPLGRSGEEREESRRVGPEAPDHVVGIDHVALGL